MAGAKPQEFDVKPDSVVSRTVPYEDELDALNAIDLNTFNVIEVDRRIALISRLILESALRDRTLGHKDRADLALRAINTLEGAKVRNELWVNERSGPIPIDVAAYEAELSIVEQDLLRLAEKRKSKEAANKALKELGETDEEDVS